MLLTPEEIRNFVNNPIPYELITFKNGKQIKIRSINSVSDEARKNLNKKYNELYKRGLL